MTDATETVYERAIAKMKDSAYKFSKDKDGMWLASFDGSFIQKKTFLDQLKIGVNCKMSDDELTSLMVHFQRDGQVDGTQFSLFFYRLRSEYKNQLRSDLLAHNRRANELRKAEEETLRIEADRKNSSGKVDYDFTLADKASAFDKIREAAFRYDRLMPGTVQLDAFDVASMAPLVFKDQLLRVFALQVCPKELGALVR